MCFPNLSVFRRAGRARALSRSVLSLIALLSVALTATTARAQDYKKQVIYEIITDRFYNGDTSNDNPAVSAGLFDATQTNWRAYWGGDLAGITAKMSYLKGMGVTAIWISPPVDNRNLNTSSTGVDAPYHSYEARDFKRVEEHFGDSGNGWTAFDNLITAAHNNGLKVIIDWANNHTSNNAAGEYGALYDSGTFLASYTNDPSNFFHHNGSVSNWTDRYQVQYYALFNLSDLNQENATVDSYLKNAAQLFQAHGVDAFRLDAIKHVTWGWQYSFANSLFTNNRTFFFGEWAGGTSDALYHDSYKFANKSGISELDFGLNDAIRSVFASDNAFSTLDSTLNTENSNFTWQNDLVTFFDSHDENRFLSVNNNTNRLHEAMAFLLTCRGIPVIYYGDEQYLHNDTSGGGDPYNRPMMTSFSTTTTAYQLINKLSTLRHGSNDALAYGGWQQRWVATDVYIYERKFFNDVVLVAINKNDTSSYVVNSGLNTALPQGTYSDYLGGLLSGVSLTVTSGAVGGTNPTASMTLPAHSVSVWQYTGSVAAPEVGSIGPTVGQRGMVVTIAGKGFGLSTGSVLFGTTAATIQSWSDTAVTFAVPNVANGVYSVQLKNSSGTAANTIQFTVLTAQQVPVTMTVNNATPTNTGDYIFVTGDVVELGKWGTTYDTAIGPMLCPNYPNWFLNVSLPAGTTVNFKFIKIAADGTVTWENGANHSYTVPGSGTGFVNVNWQY